MKQKSLYAEAAYLLGIVILALGTAFMERADFGMSMVVAPAYLFHLKISQILPFFSFGMAEYCLQAVLILIMSLMLRRFRLYYLFSFGTAVIYGFVLDAMMRLVSVPDCEGWLMRTVFFLIGLLLCALAISFLFHTYVAPEAYELLVKEIAAGFGKEITRVKMAYDCISCGIAILLSFAFFGFGHFEGVKAGTVFCALVNGYLIGRFNRVLDTYFTFPELIKRSGGM